ncbi:MAG TPA: OmpA family protein [Methylomirabilota bacterium]|jgi:chemotaxis protein MotB|nr:OmpA family protein [Methylomirabilota bacterium]
MQKSLVAVTALVILPFAAAGCVSKSEYMKTVDAANALEVDNTRLKTELAASGKRGEQLAADRSELERLLTARSGELGRTVADLRQRIGTLETENARLVQEAADAQKARDEAQKARDEKVREVSSTYEQLVDKMKGEIAKGQVTISELKGKLTVNMVDAILFDSGKAEIKPEGLVVLGKVIEILKSVNDKAIRIEGHTDAQPITGSLTQRYPTNWELSAARAITVARYLQKEAIDPGLLSAAGFGEFKPVADNATPEGRARNRRIEIVLVPRD